MENIWGGFYKKSREDKLEVIEQANLLDEESLDTLKAKKVLTTEQADYMVENVIGTFSLPFSVVPNFIVDNISYTVPMVTEEPSVIAAASNAGKIIGQAGGFKTQIHDRKMIGQVALYNVSDKSSCVEMILENKNLLLSIANDAHPSIVSRGGGARDIDVKIINEEETSFVVVYLIADTQEAMGANIINTMLEAIKTILEDLTQGEALMAILSNYATNSLVTAHCQIPFHVLGLEDEVYGGELAKKIELASKFAKADIYRAATHNKGIFNGIDSVVIATGNDWRAIEAACHSYAAKNGRYEGLSTWKCDVDKKILIGSLTVPMPIASVGGSIGINPTVKVARKLLGSPDAKTLATIICSIGLAQNFAAIRALVSTGIQKGHMKLHAKSLAVLAGAKEENIKIVVEKLLKEKHLNLATAKKIISEISG